MPARTIEQALDAYVDSLMAIPGVVGVAIGRCDDAPCIRVFLVDSAAAARAKIPGRLDGYPVRAEVTGPIRPRGAGDT
ncbi:MAG: hypothetical protein OER21_00520 [Gemmatimonadota bacterium]|nr:hypothetical protein [Gemmatimonadota bacterium]